MTVHPPEHDKIAELARLLPAPDVTALPTDRTEQLRGHLLTEFAAARATAVTPGRASGWGALVRRPATMLTAAAAAAAVTAVALVGGPSPVPGVPDDSTPAVAVRDGAAAAVAPLMERVASVAANGPAVAVRPEQYVYVRTQGQYAGDEDGLNSTDLPWKLSPKQKREIWLPQQAGRNGLLRQPDKEGPMNLDKVPVGFDNPTYAWLSALPTDPAALLSLVYEETADDARYAKPRGLSKDDVAFEAIGSLAEEAIIPPAVSAALYRALARIPGVTVVPDAVDAAGRAAVGVAKVRTDISERYELLFDPKSSHFLGRRSYLVSDTPNGKAGMLTSNTAVLGRGVADRIGQVPATTR